MIPFNNYDDKDFSALVEEARSLIHRYTDQWTDENYHDPGITFMELLSWINEMQRYYMNSISSNSIDQIMKIMGYKLCEYGRAEGIVRFDVHKDNYLPEGTQMIASDQVFETSRDIFAVSANIEKILFERFENIEDFSMHNHQKGLIFSPFQHGVEKGDKLIVGFDTPLPKGKALSMFIKIFDDYPVKLPTSVFKPHGIEFKLNTGVNEHDSDDIKLIEDGTDGLTHSGIIRFMLSDDHTCKRIGKTELYPIVFQVEEDYGLLPPQFENLIMNVEKCTNTSSIVKPIKLENGTNRLNTEMSLICDFLIQKCTGNGWIDIDDTSDMVSVNDDHMTVNVEEEGRHRIIFFRNMSKDTLLIGTHSGFYDYEIPMRINSIVDDNFKLQCSYVEKGVTKWEDYSFVKNIKLSGNHDKVFTIDKIDSVIRFGDNEHGVMPCDGSQIRLLRLEKSDFERGNIKNGQINSFTRDSLNKKINVSNPYDLFGGFKGISNEKKSLEVLNLSKHIETLVTVADYEKAIIEYPKARITLAKAYKDINVENKVKVTFVPYTGERFPRVPDILQNSIINYLDDRRLVSTMVEFIDPISIEVEVYVDIIVDSKKQFDKAVIKDMLYDMFNPIQGYKVIKGYEIGTIPSKSDVINRLLRCDGVIGIKQVMIGSKGLKIPKHSVIYCNNLTINIST